MRSLLSVISDESLQSRIKLVLNDDSIKYHFVSNADAASAIAGTEEIAVAIVDYNSPVVTGAEICELLLSYNPQMQFVIIFDEKDTGAVLDLYNSLHINKLMCREYLVLEDLPSLVESCLHTYNRDEEIEKSDREYKEMNEKYLKPMNEMSNTLNERLAGYDSITKVFGQSVDFVLNTSDKALKTINIFVDKILSDYIQIFMIKEPDINVYFNRIHESFNDPDKRKYFKFISDDVTISDKIKFNLLFCLDVITISFDCFYPMYRGKVQLAYTKDGDKIEINSIYEVRKDAELNDIYSNISHVVKNILKAYTDDCKYAIRDNIIQYKLTLNG